MLVPLPLALDRWAPKRILAVQQCAGLRFAWGSPPGGVRSSSSSTSPHPALTLLLSIAISRRQIGEVLRQSSGRQSGSLRMLFVVIES